MAGRRTVPGIAEVRSVVAAHLPGYRVESVGTLGAGVDNLAYEVNGELIVRFQTVPDPARVAAETRLLGTVAGVSPLPVPVPVFTDPQRGCLAYRKLPGVPLLDLPRQRWSAHARSIAGTLGELLAALHAIPVDRLAGLVDLDDYPLTEWLREAADTYRTIAGQVPAAHRRPIEAFLAAPPPLEPPADRYAPVFSHNDLGIEHVLADPETWSVTGVIDWSDAAIVDPAYDFGLLHRDLGPAAVDVALRDYRAGTDLEGLRRRAGCYARCTVFEDLAYGIESGRHAYVEKSLAALEWLFPAPAGA